MSHKIEIIQKLYA